MHSRALVTFAIGKSFAAFWHQVCEPNWQRYAQKYEFDLICIEQKLDISKRAQDRSVAWQKCLILSQDFARRYEQIIWLDADILINNRTAPDVCVDVPPGKVGAVSEILFTRAGLSILPRMAKQYEWWRQIFGTTGREYYEIWGLPGDYESVINTGVLVLSPQHHRELLERVYEYEERPELKKRNVDWRFINHPGVAKGYVDHLRGKGRELQMEMRPLSYELCRAGLIHWLDPRFNLMWLAEKSLYYPDLEEPKPSWLIRKLMLDGHDLERANTWMPSAFERSFFFHIGGMQVEEQRKNIVLTYVMGTDGEQNYRVDMVSNSTAYYPEQILDAETVETLSEDESWQVLHKGNRVGN